MLNLVESTITSKEIEILDKLLDPWERDSIRTDEDLIALSDMFNEEE